MKVEDLRIGNKILRKNSNDQWIETAVNLTYIRLVFEFPEDYKPIPLTEEWLYKLGFTTETGNFYIEKTFCGVQSEEGRFDVFFGDDFPSYSTRIMQVYHVHQLQNLYYALTGEELVI